jgi:fumarylacetoacetase
MVESTNPRLRSFISAAPESSFPIQNLPYGVFRLQGETPRVGAAIGDRIVDLAALERHALLGEFPTSLFDRPSLNAFMAAGRPVWQHVRQRLSKLLRHDEPRLRDDTGLRREAIVPAAAAEMLLPVEIGDYTDFYSSREHATNVGAMLRGPDNALMPNWLHLPVAYHGRASSVVVSGADLRRPWGQTKADNAAAPTFGPSQAVDFELEIGLFIGVGNPLARPIAIRDVAEHAFGVVLVNDWSARDIQKWEYVPLGPFLAKNFGTSISPWVVPLEALKPFRANGPPQNPAPLAYLRDEEPRAYDIQMEVTLEPAGATPFTVCRTNARHLYWSFAQQVAHHTSNGCNLRPGDLLASGTISGPEQEARGCLLERTMGGRQPLVLPNGQMRTYLADGDRVSMTGLCEGPNYRIGFGEVTGRLLPAEPFFTL